MCHPFSCQGILGVSAFFVFIFNLILFYFHFIYFFINSHISPWYINNLIQLVFQLLLNCLFFIFMYNIQTLLILNFTSLIMNDKKILIRAILCSQWKRTEFKGSGKKNLMRRKAWELSTNERHKTGLELSRKVSSGLKTNQGQEDLLLWEMRSCLKWLNNS